MKKIIFIIIIFALFSCKKTEQEFRVEIEIKTCEKCIGHIQTESIDVIKFIGNDEEIKLKCDELTDSYSTGHASTECFITKRAKVISKVEV